MQAALARVALRPGDGGCDSPRGFRGYLLQQCVGCLRWQPPAARRQQGVPVARRLT
jgi:hypothetical protein